MAMILTFGIAFVRAGPNQQMNYVAVSVHPGRIITVITSSEDEEVLLP